MLIVTLLIAGALVAGAWLDDRRFQRRVRPDYDRIAELEATHFEKPADPLAALRREFRRKGLPNYAALDALMKDAYGVTGTAEVTQGVPYRKRMVNGVYHVYRVYDSGKMVRVK